MERAKGKAKAARSSHHQPPQVGSRPANRFADRQVYIEFQSRQAATAAKRYIDESATEGGSTTKKLNTSYWNAGMNPFKTLPKDAPARGKEQQTRSTPSAPYNDRGNYGGGFRGRGGFGNRGNMNHNNNNSNSNNNYSNRNFGNNNMGFNNNMGGGFNGPMGGGGNFGFNHRGNMMGGGMRGGPGGLGGPGGMRGNRGGGGGNNMMAMGPMGGMPMGMPGNMGMMGMGGGMPGEYPPSACPFCHSHCNSRLMWKQAFKAWDPTLEVASGLVKTKEVVVVTGANRMERSVHDQSEELLVCDVAFVCRREHKCPWGRREEQKCRDFAPPPPPKKNKFQESGWVCLLSCLYYRSFGEIGR